MSFSVVTERACIGLANQLILEHQLPIPRIQHMSEIASTTFVCLFQALCGYLPNGIVEYPQTKEEEVRNVQLIIETLSLSFLHLPLTHIKGKSVIEMDVVSVYNLLEIFQAYARHASTQQQTESSSSPTATSPTTADLNEQRSLNGSMSSPITPTWSSCLSENRSSSSSPAISTTRQPATNGSSFSGKRFRSPPHPNDKYVPATSANHQHLGNRTQDTWAEELRNKCCTKQDCQCHCSRERSASICHVCDQSLLSEGTSSPSESSLCERCKYKQSSQEPSKDGWLRHHAKSPFKKLRRSPRKDVISYQKNCSKYVHTGSRIHTSAQKTRNQIADLSRSNHKVSSLARDTPSHQRLKNYVCEVCRAQLPKDGKENCIIHQLSEKTAPPLSLQRRPGSSILHDSSLCAKCKLNLSKQSKLKDHLFHSPPASPYKSSPLRSYKHIDDGNYSILHHCPKTREASVVKTYPTKALPKYGKRHLQNPINYTDPHNASEPVKYPLRESPRNTWTSHHVKKKWSYPVESPSKTHSPVHNTYSSSSADWNIETGCENDERPCTVTRSHSHNRIEQMSHVPSLDLDSSQETDEGPIRLRFHGSSKQVRFGRPKEHSVAPKKQATRNIVSEAVNTSKTRSQSRLNSGESYSKRKFPSSRVPPAKRIPSITKTVAVSPRQQNTQFKSPSSRETPLVRHHGSNRLPKSASRSENSRQPDKAFRYGTVRQRAGSGHSMAWQDGIVKCAATYGFEIPFEGSSESMSMDPKDLNTQEPQTKYQQDLLQHLQQEFPHLAVPTSSIESLRTRYLQDMTRMANLYLNGYASKAASLESYNLLKRQLELQNIMSRDLAASQRKNDFQVQQYQWQKMQSMGRDQRIQSVHIKQYYEDHQLAQRAKMLRSRTKEEMLFKDLYEEGITALHEKLRDMKRNVKEDITQFKNEHQGKLEAIHNHYKTQLDLLAETVATQKHNLEDQEMVLKRLQQEFRLKLRESLMSAQEQILRQDEEDFHFREQDKNRVKNIFRKY